MSGRSARDRAVARAGLALACALSWASIARAQDEFEEAAQELGDEGEWDLDDGVEDVPWDDYDPMEAYDPHGAFHAGVSLRVGGALPASAAVGGAFVELSGTLDYRPRWNSVWGMRIALAVSYQEYRAEELGGGTFVATSPAALRLRLLPLALDLGRWVVMRVGGALGAMWVPISNGGHAAFTGGACGQLVAKLFEGRLEIGVALGFQFTALTVVSRIGTSDGVQTQPYVTSMVGYVFP